jgi:hypothetical protein
MYKVFVPNTEMIPRAIEWLSSYNYDNWDFDIPLSARDVGYTFKFSDAEVASHFALKWT